MANSDKDILITPNRGQTAEPLIKWNGANNTPLYTRILDDGTISFEGTAGQLFSISDGLSGTIFSVNDISGIPSIEVLDTGEIKLAQYNGSVQAGWINTISGDNGTTAITRVYASSDGYIRYYTPANFISTMGIAPLASPALTGTPTAPTATAGTNTTQIATTAFVTTAVASSSGGLNAFLLMGA